MVLVHSVDPDQTAVHITTLLYGKTKFSDFRLITCSNFWADQIFRIFSSPEQHSRRAIVLPLASVLALASASTNVKVLR